MKLRSFFRNFKKKIVNKERTRFDLWISGISMILSIGILATTLTTAWIKRDWSSSVYEENIKIETNGSLALILEGSSTAQNAISILDQLGVSEITLKPVSNLHGTSNGFFLLNKEHAGAEYFEHLPMPDLPSQRTQTGIANGFIEFRITLLGEDVVQKTEGEGGEVSKNYIKYVFLKNDSFFSAYEEDVTDGLDPSQALRVSITPGKSNNGETFVFRNPRIASAPGEELMHSGINSTQIGGVWIADGAPYWDETGAEPADTFVYEGNGETYDTVDYTMVHQLSEYDGGITEDAEGRHIDPGKCICSFSSSDQETLTIRIWLEGTDPVCDDAIAGMKLKLFLNFEAVNCINGVIIEHDADTTP